MNSLTTWVRSHLLAAVSAGAVAVFLLGLVVGLAIRPAPSANAPGDVAGGEYFNISGSEIGSWIAKGKPQVSGTNVTFVDHYTGKTMTMSGQFIIEPRPAPIKGKGLSPGQPWLK